jgi:uncharacterized protein (TIGR02145 family)
MHTKFMSALTNGVKAVPANIAMAVFITVAVSCSTNQMRLQKTISSRPNDTLLMDRDGNKYSIKIFTGNLLWMTTNLKLNIRGSYCYEDKAENCDLYGRLYTWESAQEGCSLLGEGWRLPTNDEWWQLSVLYGGVAADSNLIRKGAYKALLNTGTSGFNAVLGGGRTPDAQYARLDAHGFYWIATESDSSKAWFSNFAKGSQSLYLQNDGEKPRAFSVRCVKKIDTLK